MENEKLILINTKAIKNYFMAILPSIMTAIFTAILTLLFLLLFIIIAW